MKLQIIIICCCYLLISGRIIDATKLLSKKRSGRARLSFVCKFHYDVKDKVSWFVNKQKVDNDHKFFQISSSIKPNKNKAVSKLKILRPEVLFHDVHIRCQLNEVSYTFPVFTGLIEDNNGIYRYSLEHLYDQNSHRKTYKRARKVCKRWNAVLYGCKKGGVECGCNVKVFETVNVQKASEKENSIISLAVKDKTFSYENFQYNLTLWKKDNFDTIFHVERVNTTDITIDNHSAGYQIEPNTAYQVHIQYSSPYWQQVYGDFHTSMIYSVTANSSKAD